MLAILRADQTAAAGDAFLEDVGEGGRGEQLDWEVGGVRIGGRELEAK